MKNNININLYSYQINNNKYNYGEFLMRVILKRMGYFVFHYGFHKEPNNEVRELLFGIGGLLNTFCDKKVSSVSKVKVWGSGAGCQPTKEKKISSNILKNKYELSMIRGPLTKSFYNVKQDILLGDPGYLCSYFIPVQEKTKNVVQVCFYSDKGIKKIKGVDKVVTTLLVKKKGEFSADFYNVTNAISSAEFVLTGSMHGAIAAHSYGIPWAIIPKEGKDIAKEWKWHDTCYNLGLEEKDIKACNTVDEAYEWWDSIKDKIKPITKEYQEQILKAFPYDCFK